MDKYEIVMPFVTTVSQGGPHDDESYVAGWEMGKLEETMLKDNRFEYVFHSVSLAQVDLLAMKNHYLYEIVEENEEWTVAQFTPANSKLPDTIWNKM